MEGTRAPLRSAPRTRAFIPPAAPRQQSEHCRLARGSVANPANDGNASSSAVLVQNAFPLHVFVPVFVSRVRRGTNLQKPEIREGAASVYSTGFRAGPCALSGSLGPRSRQVSAARVANGRVQLSQQTGRRRSGSAARFTPPHHAKGRLTRTPALVLRGVRASSWLTAFEPGSRLHEVAGSRPVAPTHQL